MWALYLLLCVCLGFIAWEDIRDRAVRTFWFIALFALLLFEQLYHDAIVNVLWQYAYNVGFLLIQFTLLQLYFALKERRFVWIFDRYIGWGDVVFVICIAGVWPLPGFLIFCVISLIFSLLIYVLFMRSKQQTVPLAGLQAICFVLARVLGEVDILNNSM